MSQPNQTCICIQHCYYHIANTAVAFNDVNYSFNQGVYGIVGQNGVGKTTFLKLLLGELSPTRGRIDCKGRIAYPPQNHQLIADKATLADALGVAPILQALERIQNGSIDQNDFSLLNDNWDIEQRIATALAQFKLNNVDLNDYFHHLSGGQKTKILLAKCVIFKNDIVIFDEPSNHLDRESREVLYRFIKDTNKTVIAVSHDRTLLNLCQRIIEITPKQLHVYGGNFDFYQTQKAQQQQVLALTIQAQQKLLNKAKQTFQVRKERHQQNQAKGRKEKNKQIQARGSYDKLALKSKQGRSEQTNRRILKQGKLKCDVIEQNLTQASQQLQITKPFSIQLNPVTIASNKQVVCIEELCFGFENQALLFNRFNLQLIGPERLSIQGANGAGKSTLLQLIKGIRQPHSGRIHLGVQSVAYLSQSVQLNPQLTLLEHFLQNHPQAQSFDAYKALAAFQFPDQQAHKKIVDLSGGERIRAKLAISLMGQPTPSLLLLDEPTNHLDLNAIMALEAALKLYQGAIIAISHDDRFLKNLNINRVIDL